jgi:hypothetical protein
VDRGATAAAPLIVRPANGQVIDRVGTANGGVIAAAHRVRVVPINRPSRLLATANRRQLVRMAKRPAVTVAVGAAAVSVGRMRADATGAARLEARVLMDRELMGPEATGRAQVAAVVADRIKGVGMTEAAVATGAGIADRRGTVVATVATAAGGTTAAGRAW